jgi:hypothetical protein
MWVFPVDGQGVASIEKSGWLTTGSLPFGAIMPAIATFIKTKPDKELAGDQWFHPGPA